MLHSQGAKRTTGERSPESRAASRDQPCRYLVVAIWVARHARNFQCNIASYTPNKDTDEDAPGTLYQATQRPDQAAGRDEHLPCHTVHSILCALTRQAGLPSRLRPNFHTTDNTLPYNPCSGRLPCRMQYRRKRNRMCADAFAWIMQISSLPRGQTQPARLIRPQGCAKVLQV